jgi:hypothetical protein
LSSSYREELCATGIYDRRNGRNQLIAAHTGKCVTTSRMRKKSLYWSRYLV